MAKQKKIKIKAQSGHPVSPDKKIFYWFSVLLFAAGLIGLCLAFSPEEEKVFDFSRPDFRWEVSAGTKILNSAAGITFSKGGPQLYVVIPGNYVDADNFDVCDIELATPIAYEDIQLLFVSPYNPEFKLENGVNFDSGPARRFNHDWLNLRHHPAWQGAVTGILLLPSDKIQSFSLKKIRFVRANLWHRCLAVWRDFTRFYDPKLGTCFSMASPLFINSSFNGFFVPFLWILTASVLLVAIVDFAFKLDPRVRTFAWVVFLVLAGSVWGLLDLRNNQFYLKGMGRDINLYWGKSLSEKRGIVVGDPEFVRFMEFCDQNIPLDANVINGVPVNLPGTPANYLSATQVGYILRPRLAAGLKAAAPDEKTYYIFYKNPEHKLADGKSAINLKMFKVFNAEASILVPAKTGKDLK
ncbi:MAG: hypothetical protein WC901_01195 [Candidatus Margulisiibacteriota bacterium]